MLVAQSSVANSVDRSYKVEVARDFAIKRHARKQSSFLAMKSRLLLLPLLLLLLPLALPFAPTLPRRQLARQILRENSVKYDKGVFAEILEPIMGKGLIPADPITWGILKRQIAQGFHKNWLNHRIGLFAYCNRALFTSLSSIATGETPTVNMEEKFNSVALDVIGKSVFNFEFDSVPKESPVIKAVYSALVEAGHRSMVRPTRAPAIYTPRAPAYLTHTLANLHSPQTPAPYWDIPGANAVVPRLRKFNADLDLLNGVLDDLISRAKNCNCLLRDTRQLRKCSRGRCSSSLVTLPS